MEEKETPRVMKLISEAESLINLLDGRLSHVLLPPYPTSPDGMKTDDVQSNITSQLRRLVRRLGELNDRVEN